MLWSGLWPRDASGVGRHVVAEALARDTRVTYLRPGLVRATPYYAQAPRPHGLAGLIACTDPRR
jgi:hypothetical protein